MPLNITKIMQQMHEIGVAAREAEVRAKGAIVDAKAAALDGAESFKGFASPQFMGLRDVAKAFHKLVLTNNAVQPDQIKALAAQAVAEFVAGYTDKTEASAKGGTNNNMARFVSAGNYGVKLLDALHERREFWRQRLADAKAESPVDQEAADMANRFLQVARIAPLTQGGDLVFTDEKGRVKHATHYGRPAKVITMPDGRKLDIEFGRGTTPLSIAASYARAFGEFGDMILDPSVRDEVIDSFLDNGGKVPKGDEPQDIIGLAARAADLVAKLAEAVDSDSPDAGMLQMMRQQLDRIASEGPASGDSAPLSLPDSADESSESVEEAPTKGVTLASLFGGETDGESGESGTEDEAPEPEAKPRRKSKRRGGAI